MLSYLLYPQTCDLCGATGRIDFVVEGPRPHGRPWHLQLCPACAQKVPEPPEEEVRAAAVARLAQLTPSELAELEHLTQMSEDELLQYLRGRSGHGPSHGVGAA
jgi:hypothetical protein